VYTVDEVSMTLSVPRPTLYRYLKEYAIPYLRRGGRISIPEDSLDRIRTVRELHEEGLGTEAVRRKLREGPHLDRIAERMDRVQEKLEGLRARVPTIPPRRRSSPRPCGPSSRARPF
jgi:excisionase family DNA binding protein